MKKVCQTLVAGELIILLLILPAIWLPSPTRSLVLLVIPLLWLIRKGGYGYFVPPTPLNSAILGLLLMLLVSLYATFDLAFSLPKIAGFIYAIAVFYGVVAFAGRSPRHLNWSAAIFLAGGVGVALVSLVAVRWRARIPGIDQVVARLPGPLVDIPGAAENVNPNEVAGVLLWMAPLALALAVVVIVQWRSLSRQIGKGGTLLLAISLLLTAGLLSGVLLLTQSRSGLAGMAVACLMMVGVGLWRYYRPLLPGLLVVAGLAAAFLIFAEQSPLRPWLEAGEQSGIEEIGASLADIGLAGRVEIWSRAVYGLQDFPFTGMGMGTFRRVVHILYPLFLISPATDIAHAHNHLLQTGLDLGIPGLIAYLAVWLLAAVILWQSWRRSPSAWQRALCLGVGGALLAYFIYGLADAVALGARPGFLFWYLLALAAALRQNVVQ